jgi:hypothetical protein
MYLLAKKSKEDTVEECRVYQDLTCTELLESGVMGFHRKECQGCFAIWKLKEGLK